MIDEKLKIGWLFNAIKLEASLGPGQVALCQSAVVNREIFCVPKISLSSSENMR